MKGEGHHVVPRPIHSPDFSPVEFCFSYLHSFLEREGTNVCNDNFLWYLKRGLESITRYDIEGYMAHAHFAVPGHEFNPYRG